MKPSRIATLVGERQTALLSAHGWSHGCGYFGCLTATVLGDVS